MANSSHQLRHSGHPHHLLRLESRPTEPYTCSGCRQIGFGNRYSCKEPGCRFHLHKDCALAAHNTKVAHEFFPGLKFRFLESPADLFGRRCDACRRDVKGYHYHCDDEGWDLHPTCLNLPATMRHRDVDDVKLRLRKEMSSNCFKCGKMKLDPGRGRSWAYVSDGGESIHVACAKDLLIEAWEEYRSAQSRQHEGKAITQTQSLLRPSLRLPSLLKPRSPWRSSAPVPSPSIFPSQSLLRPALRPPSLLQARSPWRSTSQPSPSIFQSQSLSRPAQRPSSLLQARSPWRSTTQPSPSIFQSQSLLRPPPQRPSLLQSQPLRRPATKQAISKATSASTAELALADSKRSKLFLGFLEKVAVWSAKKILKIIFGLAVSAITGNPIPLFGCLLGG